MCRTVAGRQLAIQRVHSRLQADVPAPAVEYRYEIARRFIARKWECASRQGQGTHECRLNSSR
jgi:hypothetical protein